MNKPSYHIKKPHDINSDTMKQIYDLILSGGEVSSSMLMTNLERAYQIAYASIDDRVVAVSVVKVPNTHYRDKVFQMSGSNENPNDYPYEVGYVYAVPEIRGTRIIYDAFHMFNANISGVFATVRQDNNNAIRLLQRSGYKLIGSPYKSSRGDYNLLLWVS